MNRRDIHAIPRTGDVSLRERAVELESAALLVIDMQNGEYNERKCTTHPQDAYLWNRLAGTVIPNGQRLLAACREAGVEIIFTTIESLTVDGRDRSLDHKVSGILVPRDSWEAQVIDPLAPLESEIRIPKTASSVFNSTNIEYVLRNLGVEYLLVMGIMTDQCVESAIRDGCDLGFLMTLIEDACATHTQERHEASLRALKGYCRMRSTDAVIEELLRLHGPDDTGSHRHPATV